MAGRYDITIEQGATFHLPLTIKNSDDSAFDLSGYTPRGNIRRTHQSATIVASFTFTLTFPYTLGKMDVILTDEVTASIPCGETTTSSTSKYVYDIEIEHTSGTVKRLLEGYLYVSPEVTRS